MPLSLAPMMTDPCRNHVTGIWLHFVDVQISLGFFFCFFHLFTLLLMHSAAAKATARLQYGKSDAIQWALNSEDVRVWSLMIGEFFCRAVEKCPKTFKGFFSLRFP